MVFSLSLHFSSSSARFSLKRSQIYPLFPSLLSLFSFPHSFPSSQSLNKFTTGSQVCVSRFSRFGASTESDSIWVPQEVSNLLVFLNFIHVWKWWQCDLQMEEDVEGNKAALLLKSQSPIDPDLPHFDPSQLSPCFQSSPARIVHRRSGALQVGQRRVWF